MDPLARECFAVLDTETNYDNEVISIGVVIADSATYRLLDRIYLIVSPEYLRPAMFSAELRHPRVRVDGILRRADAVGRVLELLTRYHVGAVFAYNANFDRSHLPELGGYDWYDIMRLAAYRQYNPSLEGCPCCKTGRLKTGYGAEAIYRRLCGGGYSEVHNALTDAEDELQIMEMLGHPLSVYEITHL